MKAELIHHVGDDLTVVNAARVSMDKESEWEESWEWKAERTEFGLENYKDYSYDLSDKDKKLIKYLADHKRTSPFNHAFLTFRVKAPIFVARQLVKHKFMPWNEVSRRYVDSEPEFYESVDVDSTGAYLINSEALDTYSALLEKGVCPEQVRMVLPQSMYTYTEWYWSGTLGAFLDMLKLRLDPHAQKETRVIAEMIAEEVKRLFPVSYEAVLG